MGGIYAPIKTATTHQSVMSHGRSFVLASPPVGFSGMMTEQDPTSTHYHRAKHGVYGCSMFGRQVCLAPTDGEMVARPPGRVDVSGKTGPVQAAKPAGGSETTRGVCKTDCSLTLASQFPQMYRSSAHQTPDLKLKKRLPQSKLSHVLTLFTLLVKR